MYPSHPLNVSITIRINENAHFLTVTCYMIPEALTIISTMCMILLSDYVFPLASLNTENPSTERQAFFSLSKHIEDMNHQCECVDPCKLSKGKLPRDTKFDNVRIHESHADLDEINPFSENPYSMRHRK